VLRGWRLFYDSRLEFEHYMPPHRLEPGYRDHLVQSLNSDGIILEKYYTAVKMKFKCEGRPMNTLRLLLVTPIKYLFARTVRKKEVEKNKMHFLYPFYRSSDPVMFSIKQFMKRN
jgi:hypothetical protein